jgi:hypothetical protein
LRYFFVLRTFVSHNTSPGYNDNNVQVLQVATAELLVGDNLDLALASLGDLDEVTEVSGAALDLDAVVEELLKGGGVEDLVVDGLRAVDDVLLRNAMLARYPPRYFQCAI